MPRSIVGWFTVCWSVFLLAALIVGGLLVSFYIQSTTEQLRRATAALAQGCDAIAGRYQFLTAGSAGAPVDLRDAAWQQGFNGVVQLALRDLPGIEGGIWQAEQGSLAYAFPTYEGTSAKTDLPQAEEPSIREAAEAAALDGVPADRRQEARSQILLLHACPLAGPVAHLAAWTMTRVVTVGSRAYAQAIAGLATLLVVVLGSAAWLGWLLLGWSRRLGRLEAALIGGAETLPRLDATGQRDLDRIVAAINAAGARLAEARRTTDTLARRVAEGERLAALGRVVAGVAHEIRNPIAAMRLKAENALAVDADGGRKERALHAMLEQIARLDALLRNLLSSVHQAPPNCVPVADLHRFLAARRELFREAATVHGLALELHADGAGDAAFDPARIGQAIDNLILNAIQNTPPGGTVTLAAERCGERLVLSVADTGRGVPAALRDQLFEPFVTGRADGTGLGLAIVREIAEAHGGTVAALHRVDGTTIAMELPWRPS